MKIDLKINTNPTESDLKKLEDWLVSDYEKFNEGFYCNWNIIEKSFHAKELITFTLDNEIIGFVVWSQNEEVIDIDIMEIHPDYRKRGLGKQFLEKIEDEFRDNGNIAFVLFCEPRESEHFWRKMGFIKFPNRGWSESDLTFYKPLIKVSELTESPDELNKLELWDVEPYQSNNCKPRWTWDIKMEGEKLQLPIMQPCNRNWNVRLTMNGEIKNEDKVKYFSNTFSIENGPFMFVDKLTT